MFMYKDDMFCECEDKTMPVMPEEPRLATAYVPFQHAKCIFTPSKALSEGSIFPELIMPYRNPFREMDMCNCVNNEVMPEFARRKDCPCKEEYL